MDDNFPPMYDLGSTSGLLGQQSGSSGLSGLLGDFLKDPRNRKQLAAFGQALAQAGAPSTTGNHWGLGLANALGGASKAGDQFDQDKQSQMMRDLQMQQMKATLNQKADPMAIFSKVNVDNVTPASIKKYMTTRDISDLEPRVKQEIAPNGQVFNPYAPNPNANYGAVKPVDLGGSQAMTRPDGGIVGYMQNTQSPNSVASNSATMRGQNMTDARARDFNNISQQNGAQQVQETPNGPVLINKRNGQAMPVTMSGEPLRGDQAMKRENSANRVLTLLGEADKLIPGSTGSVIGRGVDVGLGAFGVATSGAENTAKLSTLEGQLIAEMPRMEGPQSDKDVALYRQAAGDISNPMKPTKVRQAAVQTIRELQSRYSTQQRAPTSNAQPNIRIVDF